MELEKAREILEKKKSGVSVFTADKKQLESDTALNIGINAISRLIPQKPVRSEEDDDSFEVTENYYCPMCRNTINNPHNKQPFCDNPKCGQAFAW